MRLERAEHSELGRGRAGWTRRWFCGRSYILIVIAMILLLYKFLDGISRTQDVTVLLVVSLSMLFYVILVALRTSVVVSSCIAMSRCF